MKKVKIENIKSFLNKNNLVIILGFITFLRIIIGIYLPSYYFRNMRYDDFLIINYADSLLNADYLGNYSDMTLIKGIFSSLFLSICYKFKLSFPFLLTIMYVLSCIYFSKSLKNVINKKAIIVLYIILLFNPVSYSMELFQRTYRNSFLLFEFLIFMGSIIRIIKNKNFNKELLISLIVLGIITSAIYITREDTIWAVLILIILILYKMIESKKKLLCLIPIFIFFLSIQCISLINYINYDVYTYNEVSNSAFSRAYLKITEIKSDENKEKVLIAKDTFYKLTNLKSFQITKQEIDDMYNIWGNDDVISNDLIIWAFRDLVYKKMDFKNGKEMTSYFDNLYDEIEENFQNKTFEKTYHMPSVFVNKPDKNTFVNFPITYLKCLKYVSSYDEIKSVTKDSLLEQNSFLYDEKHNNYSLIVVDYFNSENLFANNGLVFKIIVAIYKYFTIILSVICIAKFIVKKNKPDKNKKLIMILLALIYLFITLGIVYTELTGFHSIRYTYLGPVYIIQNILIIIIMEEEIGKIRFNNINALFKRRKNDRKMYN